MKRNFGILILLVVLLVATTIGCERTVTTLTMPGGDDTMPGGDDTMPGGDEESANRLTLTDTYDNVRNGAHLIIAYNATTDAFEGTVTNTTSALLSQVRVEVHLYDGAVTVDELGPTPNVDLMAGESHDIVLPVMGQSFTEWVAHPEVGPSSSGGEGEGSGEHGGQSGEGTGEGTEGAGGSGEGTEGAGEGNEGTGAGEHGGEGAEGGGN